MQLEEVIDQLKFFLKPPSSTTKLSGRTGDWEPVQPQHLKPSSSSHKPSATPTPSSGGTKYALDKPPPMQGGSGALDKSAEKKWKKPEKWFSAGGVVVASKDDWSKIWIRKAAGSGYGSWSFPKGRIDKGESPPKTALREVEEETGIKAELVPGGYLGTGEGDFSITHYYLMVTVQNLHRHDKETEKVELVSWSDAIHTFARVGNIRDLRITTRALDLVEKMRKQGKAPR